MKSRLEVYDPSEQPAFDLAKLRAQRKRLGLHPRRCSWVVFGDRRTWDAIENGNYDRIQTLAICVFADFLDCNVNELLTSECSIEELPSVLEVVDSATSPNVRLQAVGACPKATLNQSWPELSASAYTID